MAGREQDNRIFVGGLSWDVSERQLEDAFSRFGKIVDSQIMVERDTGRSRGFGFLTFADGRGMEDAIREMHGKEFGDRSISVNRAEPRMGSDDPGNGYGGGGGGYSSGGRGSYGGGDRTAGPDDCYKCGRPGHWARDCPLAGGGGGSRDCGDFSSRPRYGAPIGRGSHFGGERDRYIDDRYDVGRYDDRDRYDTRDRYGSRDRYVPDRYPVGGERYAAPDRYGGAPDRYPQNGYGKDRGYDRDVAPRGGGGGRYGGGGGGGGPSRYEGRSYSDRAAPYDRPRRGGGRPSSYDRY